MHLERFKNQNSVPRASQTPTRMEICTFIDLAEFIRQMAENIHILAEARFLVMVTLVDLTL